MDELIVKLHSLGAIKFGNFELKNEFASPVLVDFTPLLSHPQISKEVCAVLWQKMGNFKFDQLYGTFPFGSLFAHFLSFEYSLPLILKKADPKPLAPQIIGSYKTGQQCLVLQDVTLWANHTLEAVDDLEAEGLKVRDVLTFIDFELGGKKKIKSRSLVFHSIIKISDILQILIDANKIGADQYKLTLDFFESNA